MISCEQQSTTYYRRIEASRFTKDSIFKTDSKNSPFDDKDRVKFFALKYFDVNPSFVDTAIVTEFPQKDTVNMMFTKGESSPFLKFGKVDFEINGTKCTLLVFQNLEQARSEKSVPLFIPFMDKTTGNQSYDAGRYLDVNYDLSGKLLIDFNLAYNPYCNYSMIYSCPVTPKENTLNIAIEAGEKIYDPIFK
jgi:uncharacterized protein (DUF1684 family)